MTFPVFKSAGYVLVHTPDMIVQNGSTCVVERATNPDSDFLKEVGSHIRSYEDVVNYMPNQVYIGNNRPEELNDMPLPWCTNPDSDFLKEVGSHIRSYEDVVNYMPNQVYIGNNRPEELNDMPLPWCETKVEGTREGKMGEIMPQDEFIALMQICDVFDLVELSEEFVSEVKPKIEANYPELAPFMDKLRACDISNAEELIASHAAEVLMHEGKMVGYVRAAHDVDVNLNAHTMFENLVVKASGVLAALHMLRHSSVDEGKMVGYVRAAHDVDDN